jgi:hypothetical protein
LPSEYSTSQTLQEGWISQGHSPSLLTGGVFMLIKERFSIKSGRSFNCHKTIGFSPFIILFFLILSLTFIFGNTNAVARELVFDPSPDEALGRVEGYKLYYGKVESSDINNFDIKNYESQIIDLQMNTRHSLPDLEEGVTYYFAATAYGKGEESVFSEVLFYLVPEKNYTINASEGTGGSISPSGDIPVAHGDSLTLGITPDTGFEIKDVLVDGNSIGAISTYTFSNVLSSSNISVHFDDIPADSNTHMIEMDEVSVNHKWQRVSFKEIFIDPVVIAKPASLNGKEPAVVRIQNVDTTGFDIRIQEWDYLDGLHCYEQISYLVIEKGSYVLPGDIILEAGSFEADGNNFKFNAFSTTFNNVPVVIASVTSINEPNAVVGRIRNISRNGFEYYLQREEKNKTKHGVENISFIACEPFSGVLNHLKLEVGTTGNKVTHKFHHLSYNEKYLNIPNFLADMQTTNGSDTANIRHKNQNLYSIELHVSEEKSKDLEVNHTNENVGYIIISDQE